MKEGKLMMGIFRKRGNRHIFSNESHRKEKKEKEAKIRKIFLAMLIFCLPIVVNIGSAISLKLSYWLGLGWRLIVFIPSLVLIVIFLIPQFIGFLRMLIESIIYRDVGIANFLILLPHIIIFAVFIFLGSYFKVIPYIEDTLISYNHNYSSIEGTIIAVDKEYDIFSKRPNTVCGITLVIKDKFNKTKTITFKNRAYNEVVCMRDNCTIEYLPNSLLGMDLKVNAKYKPYSKPDVSNGQYTIYGQGGY